MAHLEYTGASPSGDSPFLRPLGHSASQPPPPIGPAVGSRSLQSPPASTSTWVPSSSPPTLAYQSSEPLQLRGGYRLDSQEIAAAVANPLVYPPLHKDLPAVPTSSQSMMHVPHTSHSNPVPASSTRRFSPTPYQMQPQQPQQPLSHPQPAHSHPHPAPMHSHHGHGGRRHHDPGVQLFVFHLPPQLTNEELIPLFSHFGTVLNCAIMRDPVSGQSKGFAFITMCLASSSLVPLHDGPVVPISMIKPGDKVIGAAGEGVLVTDVATGVCPMMWRITYNGGEHVVTDEHLVTLTWRGKFGSSLCTSGRGPLVTVDQELRTHAQQLYAYGVWVDRTDLTRQSICFRFTLPDLKVPNPDLVAYETQADAVAAAADWGNRMIAAGSEGWITVAESDAKWMGTWERGTVINALDESCAANARYVVLTLSRGSPAVTQEKLFKVQTGEDEARGLVLPACMNSRQLVREFVSRCLETLESEELITPIYAGDLIDIRASMLNDFLQEHGASVALPLVRTRSLVDTTGVVQTTPVIEPTSASSSPVAPRAASAVSVSQGVGKSFCLYADEPVYGEPAESADPTQVDHRDIYLRCEEILAEFIEEHGLVDAFFSPEVPQAVQIVPPMKDRFQYGGHGFTADKVPAEVRKKVLALFKASKMGSKSLDVQRQLAASGITMSQDIIKKVLHLEKTAEGQTAPASPITEDSIAWCLACEGAMSLRTSYKVIVAEELNQRPQVDIDEAAQEPITFSPMKHGDLADVVYMLHNPLTERSLLNAEGKRAYTIRQLERAWSIVGVDVAAANIMITELNPIAGVTGDMDSTLPEYDKVCFATITAALLTRPKVIIAFGSYVRKQWLAAHESRLLQVENSRLVVDDDGWQSLELSHGGIVTQVLFADHPSAWYRFDSIVVAVARAHGFEVSEALKARVLSLQPFVDIKKVEQVEGGPWVGLTVEGGRFVLADGVLTHNSNRADADQAIRYLNGFNIGNKYLKVEYKLSKGANRHGGQHRDADAHRTHQFLASIGSSIHANHLAQQQQLQHQQQPTGGFSHSGGTAGSFYSSSHIGQSHSPSGSHSYYPSSNGNVPIDPVQAQLSSLDSSVNAVMQQLQQLQLLQKQQQLQQQLQQQQLHHQHHSSPHVTSPHSQAQPPPHRPPSRTDTLTPTLSTNAGLVQHSGTSSVHHSRSSSTSAATDTRYHSLYANPGSLGGLTSPVGAFTPGLPLPSSPNSSGGLTLGSGAATVDLNTSYSATSPTPNSSRF